MLRPVPAPRRRLVVFAHAGAGPRLYARLLAGLPEDVELAGVTLPGREHRDREPPRTLLPAITDRVVRELRAAEPLPTTFYGHSLGSLLALASAHAAPELCHALVLTAAPPGTKGHDFAADLDTPDGLAELFAHHRVPMDALDESRARDRAQYVLAWDLLLARDALLAADGTRVGQPLTVLGGLHDEVVPIATLPLWARFTTGRFRSRAVAGGHFFPFHPEGRHLLVTELAGEPVRLTPQAGP
ncbi:Thioesterase [Actinacidiphila cocklensis]|uniref:Thioesterase n=1 Tax=Actinacidiphila cocklensis TaxID=887465 RepID=A0A9W4GNA1_9ACTN|nr:Thioesterase [Actinacidiphila cocklensis]